MNAAGKCVQKDEIFLWCQMALNCLRVRGCLNTVNPRYLEHYRKAAA